MKQPARSTLAHVLALAVFFSAVPCFPDSLPAPLRVLVPATTAALPFLLMARDAATAERPPEKGAAGLDLKAELFSNHAQALAILLRGEADLLLSGTSQGWENRLDGSPIVMLGTGVWGLASLVGRDPAIKGFGDLRGKRLAVPFPGSPLDFQTRTLLSFEKIDPDKDVAISFGPFARSLQRLLAGQLDAAALPEPLATLAVKTNGLRRLVEYSQAWARVTGGDGQSPQVSLFATESWARDHASVVTAVLAAWDAASRRVTAAPGPAASAFAAVLDVEPSILEEAARNTILAVPSPSENRTRVLSYYDIVSKYFPAGPRPLDDRFFFIP